MEFRILGPLEVAEGGRPVPLGGGKQRSLLALLLLHANEVVSNEQLVHELWGERPPATAAKSVQVYVSLLRKVLGPANGTTGVLRTRGSGYVLCIAPDEVDVHRFERHVEQGRRALGAGEPEAAARELRQALALWHGEPLSDVAYEPFAQGEIARLQDMRLAALEDRIEADLQLGRHVELVGELEALVAQHPLRERLAGQLMVALYRSGRQAEALDAYTHTRDYLATELGLEPGPALRDVQAAVLAQDPQLAPPVRHEAASAVAKSDGGLVGRERELAEVEAALLAAWDAGGGLHLLAGEAGIGKSRLAEAVAERARARGGQVVWARVWDSGGAPAFYPWTQVVRGLAGVMPAGDLQVLAPLAPELGGARSELPAADVSAPARFALFEALTALLRAAAQESPLLVVIDDVHAADPDSLLALRFAARQSIGGPVLLLATERDPADDVAPEAAALLAELARAGGRTTLGGLDEDAVAQLIERRGLSAPPPLARAVHATTDGNPFFSHEVLQLLVAEGQLGDEGEGPRHLPLPASVKETIGGRLDLLSGSARDALRAASIVGRDFRVATVQEVVGGDGNALLEALDEAVGARLIAEAGPGRFRFSHALVRETLYAELGSVQRIEGHRAVAEALERRHGQAPEHAAELAHHFSVAAPGGEVAERAIGHAIRAGDHAGRALAYEQAIAMYELALELGDLADRDDGERRAALLLSLGSARTCAGDERARETLLAAADAARTVGRTDVLARAALAFRAWQLSPGIVDDALVGLMEEALAALERSGDSALRARLLARLAVALYYRPGSAERREALAGEAVALARAQADRDLLAYVLGNAQLATWGPDTTERSLAWSDELLELTETGPDVELALGVRNRRIDLLLELGDLPGADIAIEALDRLSRRHPHHLRAEAWVCLQRSRRALIDGDFEAAERLTSRPAVLAQRLHDPAIAMLATAQDIGLRWARGRMGEVEETTRRFADGAPGMPVWRAALARVYCAEGRDAEAQRELDRLAADGFAGLPRDNVWPVGMAMLAEVCTHLGDPERAADIERLLRPFADRVVTSPHAMFGGPVARFLGLVAACLGDVEAASADLGRARAIARAMNARLVLETLDRDEEGLGAAPPARASAPVAGPAILRREGEAWLLRYEGRLVRLRDGKGIRYLAALLASPGNEIHALDLVRLETGTTGSVLVAGDAGPMLDAQAKTAYRRRVAELREELEEAERFNDPERAAAMREEMEAIASELSGAVGLGGRDRRAASEAERARINVTRAIRTTLKRISDHDKPLGLELAATVRTGTFCAHEPDARHPVRWEVEQS
jgi:DNA-binding SARP family transcriptional activator